MDTLSQIGLDLSRFLSAGKALTVARMAALVFVGLPLVHYVSRWVRRQVVQRVAPQPGLVAGKAVYYTGVFVIAFSFLNELGFQLNTLLGAAGIVGVAVGFASQTSVSNVISGVFIMMERPFIIHDFITVDNITGQVISIDMLSVKLKTEDNQFVRIPNEILIKNKLVNTTRFPTRRLDIHVGVAYREEIGRVRTVLMELARDNPLCLQDPPPQVVLPGYGTSAIDFLLQVWTARDNMLTLKNDLYEAIKIRFETEGIEIPFPHMTVYAGVKSEPFPLRILPQGSDPGEKP